MIWALFFLGCQTTTQSKHALLDRLIENDFRSMSLATEHFSTTVPDQPHIIGTMKRRTQAIQMKKDLPLGEKRDWVLLSLDYELEQLKKQGSPSTKRLRELRQLRQRVQDF